MLIRDFRIHVLSALALAAVGGWQLTATAQEDGDSSQKKRRVIVIENDSGTVDGEADDNDDDGNKRRRVIVRRGKSPKYWIGVACSLDDDGVSVGEVLPDSPAAKAGLKSGDRILSTDDFAVAELSDLVEAVQTDETIRIKVQRGDETLELDVTPAERPRNLDGPGRGWEDIQLHEGWEELMPHLRGLMGDDIEDFDISMIQPGVVLGPAEIPDGVSISVRRDGEGPAKITIERGDDSWEVTEDSVDELPEDLRATAKKMLAAVGGRSVLNRPGVERHFERILPGMRVAPGRVQRPSRESQEELRSQVEQMREEIRELREMLKELRDK